MFAYPAKAIYQKIIIKIGVRNLQSEGQISYRHGNDFLHQPIKFQCCPRIETSQLISYVNQLTGFYMRATLAFNGLITKRVELTL